MAENPYAASEGRAYEAVRQERDVLREQLAAARVALGEAWTHDGVSLAVGIERKTRALESMPGGPAAALVEAVLAAHRDDVPPRIRDLALAVLTLPTGCEGANHG